MSGDFDPASDEAPSTYRVCFDSTLSTVALVVTPKDATGRILAAARGWVLSRRGVRAVHDHSDDAKRILLCPDSLKAAGVEPTSISAVPDLPRALADALQPVSTGSVALTLVPASFAVTAHSYTMDQILAKLLPSNVVVPSGFEQIGHIAHLNLQDAQLPYKRLIGQVLLDCNRSAGVRTVVHKLEIASQFRELKLELLAGEDNLVATVRQHGITFKVPFDKVYWNSKLSREHERLIEDIRAGDVLFDVMAGIGPFVIPALRKGATVYGNDLNPASVEAMIDNVKTNTTVAQQAKFTSSCEDGRAFVRRIRRDVLSKGPDPHGALRHFAMNLPALAVTFLDAFSGNEWHDDEDARVVHDRTFRVHCYCFSKTNDPAAAEKDAVKQCSVNLGFNLVQGVDVHAVHVVRDVAPNKLMVCVSFSLPSAVFDAPPRRQHRKEA